MTGKFRQFVQGLGAGVLATTVIGTAVVYGLQPGATVANVPAATAALDWIYTNLGFAVVLFAATTGLYLTGLRKLRQALRQARPVEDVAHAEHLVDIWTSLFFGIGVIWTAIGMRSALIYALGDPGETIREGAFAVLQRMVDGGILLALSTTIVGGIGGYLMRVVKAVSVGTALKRYYEKASRAQGAHIQSTLDAIEAHLARLSREHLLGPQPPSPDERQGTRRDHVA